MWRRSVVFLLVLSLFIEIGDCIECKYEPHRKVLREYIQGLGSYKFLDLRWCGNERLEIDGDFKGRNYLIAEQNCFSKLEANTFVNISNLVIIDLHNNKIKEISREAFKGLSKLTTLDLSYNYIEELKVGAFDPLTALKILKLQKNQIKVLMEGIFDKNLNLITTNFERNEIFAVGPNVLKSGVAWNFKGNKCADEDFPMYDDNLAQKTENCVENYELNREKIISSEVDNKENSTVVDIKCNDNDDFKTIIICVEMVALIMCFVIFCCQWKNTRKLPTNTLTKPGSDNVESFYSNTQSNIPGQQEPEMNYATLDLATSNAPPPARNDRIIYSVIKR
jgi:hypothetical protein